MSELFGTAIKYGKTQEDGIVKSVTEHYLVDAVSHADAEHITMEQIGVYTQGDAEITKVNKIHIPEVIVDDAADADEYWKVSYDFITLDEKTMKEKKTRMRMLIQCRGVKQCVKKFFEVMAHSMVDFEVTGVTKTGYIDYLKKEEE